MQRDRQSAEPHGRPSAAASAASRSRPSSASVELIRFARPKPGVNLLTIRGFSPNTSPEKLHQIFSECGLIDNLVIYKSDDRSRGSWATVQYFSSGECSLCLHSNNGRVVDGAFLSVYPMPSGTNRSQRPAEDVPQLSASKGIDMMNHFVGFSKWSHEVLSIRWQALQGVTANGQQRPAAEAVARVRVSCPGGVTIELEGVGTPGEGGQLGHAPKQAVTNALKAALCGLAIVRWPSGKVAVRLLPEPSVDAAG